MALVTYRKEKGTYFPSSVSATISEVYNRYANMDFLLFFTLLPSILMLIGLSYDFICQWLRKLKTRMLRLPQDMWMPAEVFATLLFFIPKFHIYGHGDKCQHKYLFNFQKWSTRNDGEAPEWFWAHINPLSMSTKEMSPGARFDVLDSHATHWNWRKIVNFGWSAFRDTPNED